MTVFTTLGAGSFHGLSYAVEATFGVSPATGSMTSLRHTTCGLILNKDTFQSAELRSDRQIVDFRHGTYQIGGDIGFELSYGEYDTLIEAGLGGTWSGTKTITGSIGVQGTLNQFYSSAVTFTSLATGDCVYTYGFSAATNNGFHYISGALPNTITVNTNLITGVASAATVSRMKTVKNGVSMRSFTVERAHSDIDQYGLFAGCVIDGFDLTMRPNAIVTGTIRVLGKSASYSGTTHDTTPTASQTGSPYDTFAGAVKEGGTAIALLTGIDFSLTNNGEPAFVIGSQSATSVVLGRCNITGTVEAYFDDLTLFNKFKNETESSLEVNIGGTDQYYKLFLPRVKYGGSDTSVDGEGPITLRMPFQALYSSTYGCTIALSKIDV